MDFCLALILYARYSYFKCAPIKFYLFCILRYGGLYDYGVKFDCILGNNGIKVKAVGDFKIWIYGSEVKFG